MSSFIKFTSILLCLTLLFLFHEPVSAAKKTYVVYLGGHQHGLEDPDQISKTHYDFLGSFLRSREEARDSIFYSYTEHLNGFAAKLEEEDAIRIAQHPSVVSVFVNSGKQLHTTNSFDFMLLEKNGVPLPRSLWRKAKFGRDIIIANLDTGVWPESKSFSDRGMGPVPLTWKGKCQNNTKEGVPCNRKLISASYFLNGYVQAGNDLASGNYSARDHEGHGTHTLSTAGGNFVKAEYYGVDLGIIKGGAPKSRVAAYKVCWPQTVDGNECYDADIIQGFNAATKDRVDVISMSVGGGAAPYVNDSIAIGSFHAVMKGIVVVCSGGNSGPSPGTISNTAPWIINVAASTTNRAYQSTIVLGNGELFKGASMTKNDLPKDKMFLLISGEQAKAENATSDDAMLCKEGTLDPAKAQGKIVACLRGEIARVAKAQEASSAGAVAMILCNDKETGNETMIDQYVIPTTHVIYKAGQDIFAYINTTTVPLAYMTAPAASLDVKPAPYLAPFSSVGPNTVTPEILKPDITAPGVDIVASYKYEEDPINNPKEKTPVEFMSGTSMACPHVAGVAALLKSINPDWSPAAIRSAIVTTARTRDNTGNPMLFDNNGDLQKGTPFNYGHGHMRPNHAANPGLIYDLTKTDYLNFLCASGYNRTMMKHFTKKPYHCPVGFNIRDFNYPSISVVNVTSEGVTVTRKVKNVGTPGTYAVTIRDPAGFSVSVEPTTLKFEKIGEEKTFKVTLKSSNHAVAEDFVFGGMTWTDGRHYVRSPLVAAAAATVV